MKAPVLLVPLAVACGPGALETVLEDDPRGAYMAAWGSADDDVWVVGGQADAGVVLRGDRKGFDELPVPAGTPILDWVHGTGPDDVWVGGLTGTILHWDGADWEDHSLAIDEAIWGLYVRDTDDVWFVGGSSRWGGEVGVVYHFDGAEMRSLALPPELADLGNVFKVNEDGERIWVVGTGGAAAYVEDGALVAAATGTSQDLVTITGGAEGPMVVVGGRGTGLVMLRDGDALTQLTTVPAGLNGVVSLDDEAVVVGEGGFIGAVDLATGAVEQAASPTSEILHGSWVDSTGRLYAVGGNLGTAAATFEGVIVSGARPEMP